MRNTCVNKAAGIGVVVAVIIGIIIDSTMIGKYSKNPSGFVGGDYNVYAFISSIFSMDPSF